MFDNTIINNNTQDEDLQQAIRNSVREKRHHHDSGMQCVEGWHILASNEGRPRFDTREGNICFNISMLLCYCLEYDRYLYHNQLIDLDIGLPVGYLEKLMNNDENRMLRMRYISKIPMTITRQMIMFIHDHPVPIITTTKRAGIWNKPYLPAFRITWTPMMSPHVLTNVCNNHIITCS